MENNFKACVTFVLDEEGGFTNDPRDPGGATNFGITLHTLSRWRGGICTVDDVRALTRTEAEDIYHLQYWAKMRADSLPAGVDLMVFDFGVNAGPARGVQELQQALGVARDGVIGPITLAALAAQNVPTVLNVMAGLQKAYYQSLSTYPVFGRGWDSRTIRRLAAALHMAAAA
jgi:lysozyme family protein